jgi:hypothetical protein
LNKTLNFDIAFRVKGHLPAIQKKRPRYFFPFGQGTLIMKSTHFFSFRKILSNYIESISLNPELPIGLIIFMCLSQG